MAAKRFTLEENLDCYNYGIWVVDIIKDNGIELPQSTACDLLNKLTEENEELKKENNKLICIIKQLEAKYEDKGFSLAYDMGECE